MEQNIMRFRASLVESVNNITGTIIKEFSKQVKKLFNIAQPKIEKDLRTKLADAIRAQPEYSSLKGGELRYNFGIADSSIIDNIVDRFVNSITVATNIVNTNSTTIDAELVFSIVAADDLDEILSSADASIITEKGDSLPWLNWLLIRGNDTIILTHKILITPSPYSRTGQAIMIPSKAGTWRVPPRYIGTLDNNWITRAISSIEPEINNILSKHIKT